MGGEDPVIGWICAEPAFFPKARAQSDEEYEASSATSGDIYLYRRGRIGSVNVIISQLPQAPPAEYVNGQFAEDPALHFSDLEAILVTGVVDGIESPDINDGDLIIASTVISSEEFTLPSTSNTIQRAVGILQKEVGADGRWLTIDSPTSIPRETLNDAGSAQTLSGKISSHPQLHYLAFGSPSSQIDVSVLQGKLEELKKAVAACVITGCRKISIPIVLILGVARKVSMGDNASWKEYFSSTTAHYAKELIETSADSMPVSSTSLQCTEKVLRAPVDPQPPPFEPQQIPVYGSALLFVIPTDNQHKIRLCQKYIRDRVPNEVAVHTMVVPVDSGVGEQPYNEAGMVGAHNRITHAIHHLQGSDYESTLQSKGIGTVTLMAIENYIQFDGVEHPADYGVVIVHNASAQKTTACISCGVTVPLAFVDRARRFGFVGNPNHGRVTVGQVLAAHVPRLDKADWQKTLAGRSRYDILEEAVGRLQFPR